MARFFAGKPGSGETGITLIEVMVSTGLLGLVFLVMMTLLKDVNVSMTGTTQTATLNFLRSWVVSELNRPVSWINTYSHSNNSAFTCTWTSTACPSTEVPFNIYDSGNRLLFQTATFSATPAHTNHGFTLRGSPCTGAPSLACPIRLDLTWQFLANTAGYYPVGELARGKYDAYPSYFPSTGGFVGGYFGGGYYGYFGYYGVQPVSVNVKGTFRFHSSVKFSPAQYNFQLLKDIP